MLASERNKTVVQSHRAQQQAPGEPRRPRWRRRFALALLIAGVAVAAVAAVALLRPDRTQRQSSSADGAAKAAAESFLNEYVDANGRVVRHDQGGDTVSEGQAYALLLAQADGDQATFDRIWTWTRSHLQEQSGLFAFRANPNGTVADRQPASDADVLIAWALLRMNGPRAAEYHRAGLQVANAVLAKETVRRGDTLMLAAGPWATGEPVTLDPSYWAPSAFEQLGQITGDTRWTQLDDATLQLSTEVTAGGRVLPPDWAKVAKTFPQSEPAPNGQSHFIQYGLDAQRLPVWLATSCNSGDRQLAARFDPLLKGSESALAITPQGQILDQSTNATPFIAAAAAAQAAGNINRRDSLFAQAISQNQQQPTYYGSAWIALGKVLLTTHLLGGCPDVGS